MCAAGGRSIIAATLLQMKAIRSNISDGFSGNSQDPGWKNSGLTFLIILIFLLSLQF